MIMIYNGPEETTYIEQGVRLHIEVIAVNWWCAAGMVGGQGKGGDECSLTGRDGEILLSKLSKTFS